MIEQLLKNIAVLSVAAQIAIPSNLLEARDRLAAELDTLNRLIEGIRKPYLDARQLAEDVLRQEWQGGAVIPKDNPYCEISMRKSSVRVTYDNKALDILLNTTREEYAFLARHRKETHVAGSLSVAPYPADEINALLNVTLEMANALIAPAAPVEAVTTDPSEATPF